MSEQFIPLIPRGNVSAVKSDSAGSIKVVSDPDRSFQPVNTAIGKQPATSSSQPTAPCNTSSPGQITLKRDGDRVTHICVTCSCGQVIELACVY